MRTSTLALLSLALLPSLLAQACGSRDATDGPRREVLERLIREPEDRMFSVAEVRETSRAFTWGFEEPGDLEAWTVETGGEARIRKRGLAIDPAPDGQRTRLVRDVDLTASEVYALTVEIRGFRRGYLRLFWAAAGEEFTREASLRGDPSRQRPGFVTFELARHPLWRGEIASLRLDLPSLAEQPLEIVSIDGDRHRLDPERLAGALRRSWRVDLDHEVRGAVLTPPGVPHVWTPSSSPRGALRFAYGLPPGVRQTVRFRISRRDGGGDEVLFEATVEPSRAGLWHDEEIELDAAAEGARLVFETFAEGEYDLLAGLPAWGNPEILVASRGPAEPNVILVSIDTLRADRLSLYGYEKTTSPEIDAWAAEHAVTFTQAVATSPWTLPSHVSMLTGLDALSHGVNHELPAPRRLRLVPETLRAGGYATAAITGSGWLHPTYGLAQGFDVFRYWSQGTADQRELEDGIERVLGTLERLADRPFFLFFHTYEAHDPYHFRPPYTDDCLAGAAPGDEDLVYAAQPRERLESEGFPLFYQFVKWRKGENIRSAIPVPREELPRVSCLYDGGISYVDHHLGRLLRRVRELGLDRDTLVILTSDHGESLGENGLAKHAYLVDDNLMVPLVVGLPGGRHGGRRVDHQVSITDIVPTILDVVGLAGGGDSRLDGESLLPLVEEHRPPRRREAWAYAGSSNFGLALRVGDRAKLTFNNTAWPPLRGRAELYRLAGEETLADDASPEELERLQERLLSYLRAHAKGVRVTFENRGCGPLRGRLRGKSLHVGRVKTDAVSTADFEWLADRQARFQVAPGETFSVLLEAPRGDLAVRGAIVPCGGGAERAFDARVDLETLDEPWRKVYAEGWGEEAAAEGEAEILLRREGREPGSGGEEPEPADPELIERLRALGYIE